MNNKEFFKAIALFLNEHSSIFQQELLKTYPSLPYPVDQWAEELLSLSTKEILDVKNFGKSNEKLSPDFNAFLNEVNHLQAFLKKEISNEKISPYLNRKMTPKKQHELAAVKSQIDDDSFHTIIDIGGGVGHLSSVLIDEKNIHSYCLDKDEDLLNNGRKRLEKWLPSQQDKISFVPLDIQPGTSFPFETDAAHTLMVGLHSCGTLSVEVLRQAVEKKIAHVYNVGCCYHHLGDRYNLSKIAQNQGLQFSKEAFHLAAHSYHIMTESDWQQRLKVKGFRYALHLFLHDRFDLSFTAVGNAKSADYEGAFSAYAKKYHTGQELYSVSEDELDQFYVNECVQNKIRIQIVADIIREQLGRLIEMYLVVDRAMYLEENGYQVEFIENFDRKISPRNLSIIGHLLKK